MERNSRLVSAESEWICSDVTSRRKRELDASSVRLATIAAKASCAGG